VNLIDQLKLKAKKNKRTIVLPEGEDARIIEAASRIIKDDLADIILIGNEVKIKNIASELNVNINGAKIIDPISSSKKQEYADNLYELRKHKGMTHEEASTKILEPVYFGLMLVKTGQADGLVGGAVHSSADLLRPALQIIKASPSSSIVSSFFIIKVPNCNYGDNGLFIFADCGLVAHPNSAELADIAIQTADVAKDLCNMEPKVALLSFSTKGSAKDLTIDSIKETLNILNSKRPDIKVDGELQVDAAIVPEIALVKAPGSPAAGSANVLIFPDINSGNIGYKLVERLANAQAIGPLCCGFDKPVNDLSRGCSVDDIVKAIIITSVQAQKMDKKVCD
jgi:phosphate acetyltransferase